MPEGDTIQGALRSTTWSGSTAREALRSVRELPPRIGESYQS